MALIVYSALRLALLAVTLVIGWAVGLGGWLLVVVAAFAAWALSYLLLSGPRERAALWLADRAERRRASGRRFTHGVEADAVAEDREDEDLRAAERPEPEVRDPEASGSIQAPGSIQDGQSASPRPSSTP